MKTGMKSQRGITDYDIFLPLVFFVILTAVALPNFFQACDRARRMGCVQSLSSIRRTMKMYANDHDKSWYPKELNGKIGSPDDVNLLNSLGKYTNITNTLKDCTKTVFISVTLTSGFTISAIAKDRNKTLLTATPDTIIQP